MKKFYSLLLALLVLSGGSAFGYQDDGNVNNKEISGGTAADPIRVYELVRYGESGANASSISAGDVVVWSLVSDDGVTIGLNSVVGAFGAVLSNDAVAGVAVGTIPTAETAGNTAVADLGRRNWGYIQTYGYNSAVKVDGSTILAGSGLRASADPRRAGIGSAATGSVGGGPLGFAFDATSASSDAAEVFIRTR